MDIRINLETFRHLENSNLKIDSLKLQKMILLYNALEDGWSIKHKDNSYIFTKKHQNKKEVLHDSYLLHFLNSKLDIKNILA
jgi:hypothetical protein